MLLQGSLAQQAAHPHEYQRAHLHQFKELEPEPMYDSLMAREQLGSTGLGNGIAIPHCRVANCTEIIGSPITLEKPTEYDAIDGKPADILFVLIVPEQKSDEHITALQSLQSC